MAPWPATALILALIAAWPAAAAAMSTSTSASVQPAEPRHRLLVLTDIENEPDDTQSLIRAYVRERDDSPYAPLFVSHGRGKGKPLTPRHAWQLVKNAAEAEGLYDNTSPHSLRHRRAQDLLDEGMPLEWVAALLGHEHADTTRVVYAWETDEARLADMVNTYGLTVQQAAKRAAEQNGGEDV